VLLLEDASVVFEMETPILLAILAQLSVLVGNTSNCRCCRELTVLGGIGYTV